MSGLDALQSVQFLTKKGKRLAILSAEDWESLIDWLESLEDVQIARQAFADLKAAKGSRRRAGCMEGDEISPRHGAATSTQGRHRSGRQSAPSEEQST